MRIRFGRTTVLFEAEGTDLTVVGPGRRQPISGSVSTKKHVPGIITCRQGALPDDLIFVTDRARDTVVARATLIMSRSNFDQVGHSQTQRAGGTKERPIDSRYHDFPIVHRFSRRQVDGVIPAKAQLFGKGPGSTDTVRGDFHRVQLVD